jgi:hypothetical protein
MRSVEAMRLIGEELVLDGISMRNLATFVTTSASARRDDGRAHPGASEAIMLGALSLKWKWRARREAAGKATDRPNLVAGGDVHVVWEKVLPLLRRRAAQHHRRRRGARDDVPRPHAGQHPRQRHRPGLRGARDQGLHEHDRKRAKTGTGY